MNFSVRSNFSPDINVTPLLDVILMLLIFFMISTSFVFQPGIMIKLPQSATAQTTSRSGAQVLITSDGEIYFERLRTSLDEIMIQMKEFPDKSLLLIKADQSVSHGTVVKIMDRAKRSGFERLAIATRADKGGE